MNPTPAHPGLGKMVRATGRKTALRWISTAKLATDSIRLAGMLPRDITLVAGIPRSGMIPAAILAAHLHLPLAELSAEGVRHLAGGSRTRMMADATRGRVLVVDDTAYGGTALRRARRTLADVDALYAAVYVRREVAGVADIYAEILPSPHLLEWNLMNNGPFRGGAHNRLYGAGIACDFDGILCHDLASGGAPGSPYLLPRMLACRLIVTGRHESSRTATEDWLRAWGVRWDRLEMLPDGTSGTAEAIARHKSQHYAGSDCGFFLESDPGQAARIHEITHKPVICPIASRVWPEEAYVITPTREAQSRAEVALECVCSGPGHCPQYGRTVSRAEYELCSCTCQDERFCTPPLCQRRRHRWLDAARAASSRSPATPPRVKPLPAGPSGGPGTELKRLLSSLGIQAANCACNDRARQMDAWGVAGCKENRETILAWLRQEQARRGWRDKLKAAALAVSSGLAFRLDPLDPAAGLLDEALRRCDG